MTIRSIAQVGDPVLRLSAREVDVAELLGGEMQALIDDMIETKREVHGAGIAAPQVGVSVSIAVIEVLPGPRYPYKPAADLTVIVNPRLESVGEDRYLNNEGCLSVPSLRGDLWRHRTVRVLALDRHGEPFERTVDGLTAGTFQHEVDHLRGMLFLDRVDDPRSFTTWEEFDKHHSEEFIDRISSLDRGGAM